MLYVLTMEPFANRIRRNPNFKGLQLPGCPEEARISGYADDATLIICHENTINLVFWLCKCFGKASGSELNYTKTCILGWGLGKVVLMAQLGLNVLYPKRFSV